MAAHTTEHVGAGVRGTEPFDFELMGLILLRFIQSEAFGDLRIKIVVPSEILGAAVALREIGGAVRGEFAVGAGEWDAAYARACRSLFESEMVILPQLRGEVAEYLAGGKHTVRPLREYAALPVCDNAHYALTLEGHHFRTERRLYERSVGLALLLVAAHYIEHFEHPRGPTPDLRYLMVKEMRVNGGLNYGQDFALALYDDLALLARAFVPEGREGQSNVERRVA